jgi:hypothetical protein
VASVGGNSLLIRCGRGIRRRESNDCRRRYGGLGRRFAAGRLGGREPRGVGGQPWTAGVIPGTHRRLSFPGIRPAALPCAACLGDLGGNPEGPVFALVIGDQKLDVGWRRVTREITEVKLIIGYDRESGVIRLLGDETLTTDPLSGKSSRLIRDYDTGTMTSDGRESSFPPRFIPLIEVSAEDY